MSFIMIIREVLERRRAEQLTTVRMHHRRYIELLRNAVRVADLEDEVRAVRAQTAEASGALIAEEIASSHAGLTDLERRSLVTVLLRDLPVTADGELHETALSAWADSIVWTNREVLLRRLNAAPDAGGGVE